MNLENINSLTDFYPILESNALQLEKGHDLKDFILKYKSKTELDEEKQLLQWELEVFIFSFIGSRVFSFSTSNGKEPGEIAEYPTLDAYQQEAFEYIKKRVQTSNSALLKARYNHILWESIIGKDRRYADAAFNNYILVINECCDIVAKEKQDQDYGHLIGKLYENLIGIASSARLEYSKLKSLTNYLLFELQPFSFWAKHGIVNNMLKYPKIFRPADFKNVLSIYEAQIKNSENAKSEDFLLVHDRLPTAIQVAQKTGDDVRKWHNEVGYAYLRMTDEETQDDRNWIKLDNYRAAIDAFRLSGNKEKREETEQLYFELKPSVRLEEYRIDFDEDTIKKIKESDEELKAKAKELLKESPEYIYRLVANGAFFPKYDAVLKASREKEADFLDFVTTLYFDNNKNISRHQRENEDERKILEVYGRRIKETLLPFLHYVIVLGIKSGHLTAKNFLAFLVQHSWIGKTHIRTDLSGNPEQTNWILQVAPAIVDFFSQVLAWGESKYYNPNFILCTDSLTLKMEGLFRNFSERLNVSTSIGKKKGMQEALAHDVINNEIIKKYFNENDRLLFDYVFSNEGGLNLRNNIAHCFYSENEYHPDKMLLLLAVLLRLGKYNIKARQ